VVNTGIDGLSVNNTMGYRSLAATATHGDTVHTVALLGLISQLVCLIGTGGAAQLYHLLSLTVLPCSIIVVKCGGRGSIE